MVRTKWSALLNKARQPDWNATYSDIQRLQEGFNQQGIDLRNHPDWELRMEQARENERRRHNVRPVNVNMQRANVQQLIEQVRRRGQQQARERDHEVDFNIEPVQRQRGDRRANRADCRNMLYGRKKTRARYKNNRSNRRLGRVGKRITRWCLTNEADIR
ncbi:TPA_asm: UCH [Hydra MELD virus]|nr:TPA_asm: UCH [Hydra MELD virus]